MMSLTKITILETVKKQFLYKLKANIDAFSALVGVQLLAIVFSLGGTGMSGGGNGGMNVEVNYLSANLVIIFTFMWAFVSAITINNKVTREQDFTFVTNRMSSSLSNILFLVTVGLLGSFTAILAGNLVQAIVYLFLEKNVYRLQTNVSGLFTSIAGCFLYLLVFSSIGYLVSSLSQVNKLFKLIIPFAIIGLLFLGGVSQEDHFIVDIVHFYFDERNLALFSLKTVLTAGVFYAAGTAILQRLEVRR
ncbi:hypothetical protein [Bacillus sp. FJAT-18017]|uniref:hypothetical protein n=1 Tax=Bacillus sp. FJAT-18017 TaxID=1705566 RepID=UPI0012E3160D|nr:hypothetical protein [Bacillus sp. FJAT-18017]